MEAATTEPNAAHLLEVVPDQSPRFDLYHLMALSTSHGSYEMVKNLLKRRFQQGSPVQTHLETKDGEECEWSSHRGQWMKIT
jgi:hypothetical protein